MEKHADKQEGKVVENMLIVLGDKIRKLRHEADISIQRLSEISGVSPAGIYKIETGQMTPSVTTLVKISNALGKKASFFIEDFEQVKNVEFVKADKREKLPGAEGKLKVEILAGMLENCKMYGGLFTVSPDGRSADEHLMHEGEEFIFCLDGKVDFNVGDDVFHLEEGDALHYKTEIPHSFHNHGKKKAKLLYILTPPGSLKESFDFLKVGNAKAASSRK